MGDQQKKDAQTASQTGISGNVVSQANAANRAPSRFSDDAPKRTFAMEELTQTLGVDPDKAYEEALKYSDQTPTAISASEINKKSIEALAARKDGLYRTNENYIASICTPSSLYGVGGMPASYLHNTDPPSLLSGNGGVGAYYLKHNVTHGQFIVFQPGYIRWDLSSATAKALISSPESALGTIAKLFTGELTRVEKQTDTYWFDVERACRYAIYMMGIQDIPLTFTLGASKSANNRNDKIGNNMASMNVSGSTVSAKLGQFRRKQWSEIGLQFATAIANKTQGIITDMNKTNMQNMGIVPFFVNGNIEATTTLSSSTANNPLQEAVQGLIGDTTGVLKSIIGRVGLQGSQLGNTALAYFTGNPMMPQVWQSSGYEKAYNVSFKFISHSGDPVSSFLNTVYPTIKLALLGMPLGIGGFQTSPPILKVFSQGSINTEYGMITYMNITRNMKNASDLGMPTDIEITCTVVDLNPFLYKERPGWFQKSVQLSTGFSNFIATITGANVTTIPSDQRKTWEDAMVKLDSAATGAAFRENISFGINNFINRTMGNWDTGAYNLGLKVSDTVGRLSGFFGVNSKVSALDSNSSSNAYNTYNIFSR